MDYFAEEAILMFEHYLKDSFTYSESEKSQILLKFQEVKELMKR